MKNPSDLFYAFCSAHTLFIVVVSLSFITLWIAHVIGVCFNKNIIPLDGVRSYSGGPAETPPDRPV